MADKKITALTALTATGKVSSTDLLHIIDYSASPVNKKITVSDIFSNANTAITSYGAYTHDFGPTNAISGLSVVIPNATPAASAETEVVVNDDGNAFVDFRVESSLSASAIHVDASLDSGAGNVNTVTINGDSAKVDFKVNSDTGILIHCDSTDHVVGFGTAAPDTAYIADFAAVSGKSIKTAGSVDITGAITTTTTAAFTGDTTIGSATAGMLALSSVNTVNSSAAIPTTTSTTLLSIGGSLTGALGAGTNGQIKTIICTVRSSGSYVCTPSSLNGSNTTITFDAVGESATLIYHDSEWNILSLNGATAG